MSVDKLRLLLLFLLYAAVSSAPCAILKNYVVGDGDNIGGRNNVTSTDECCALCQASSKCVAWNLHTSGVFKDECFLHGSADNSRYDTSSVSGLARGTFAPTPVPPPPPGIYETGFACNASNSSAYKFCDSSLSHEERLADLVPRIEDKEIGAQLTARQSPRIERLGIPSYYWGTNAIHGVQNVACLTDGQCPTSFPAPNALSAAFNSSLVYDMGNVIGKELRAYYNEKIHNSLDTWSPTININRDPRW
jgi:hypothetical protein